MRCLDTASNAILEERIEADIDSSCVNIVEAGSKAVCRSRYEFLLNGSESRAAFFNGLTLHGAPRL